MRFTDDKLGLLCFFSEAQINIAVRCKIFVMDATFALCPIGFYQFFTIHGLFSRENTDQGEWVPVGWALMEKRLQTFYFNNHLLRQKEHYVAVLKIFNAEWKKKSNKFVIGRIHSDYERAEMAAIEEVFGPNLLRGCLFHYVKAVLLSLRKHAPNLFKAYSQEKNERGPFWKWVGLF